MPRATSYKLAIGSLLSGSMLMLAFSVHDFISSPGIDTELLFSEGSGTTTADGSGNAHTGTLVNGAAWTPGKYGNAIGFDGVNDYVSIADQANYTLDPAISYTWSAWVRNNNFKEWSTVWSQTVDQSNYFYFYTHSTSDYDAGPVTNGISVYWYSNNGANKLVVHSNNNVLTTGQWAHIAITYDATKAQSGRFTIYVNGTDVTARTDISSSGTLTAINPTNTRIGANQPFGEYINGAIDDVRYYRRLLSPAEIANDMNIGGAGPDLEAPAVSIAAPTRGSTVAGNVDVIATASDNVGVTGVQFMLDGIALGTEDLLPPFSTSWNTNSASNGSHTLTARARDAAGNISTSATLIVSVFNVQDIQAPTVSISAPLPSATVAGIISVTADAGDDIGVTGVQFLIDGIALGAEDNTTPYAASWNTISAANGNHTITARARDAAGKSTTSLPTTVTVFNSNLVAAFSFQENTGTTVTDLSGKGNNGTLTNGPAWSTTGKYGTALSFDGSNDFISINDAASLDLTNGMTLEAWVLPSNLSGFKTVISKENGTNNLAYTLSANNNTSNTASQRPSVRLRIGSSTRTLNGTSKLPLTTWTHLATTYDGANQRLFVNGVQVSSRSQTGNITVTNNRLCIGGSPALGAQYFAGLIDEVRIYNRALTAAEITTDMNTPLIVDNTPPAVSLTLPGSGGSVTGTIGITAAATDNYGVTGVQFLLDGIALGAEDLASPYETSWNTTTVNNGPHTLTARARDAAGNTTISDAVNITVNNPDIQPPSISITSPVQGSIVGGLLTVSASASDNTAMAGVQFLLDGISIGTEDLEAPYTLDWNTAISANGMHSLSAVARDASGNSATSLQVTVTVTNDAENPMVMITSPPADATLTGTIVVQAYASDDVGVAGVQFLLDGNILGNEVLAPPYSVSWNTAGTANGSHVLTARARDASGKTTLSAALPVLVQRDEVAPAVAITAPAEGTTVSGQVSITATATDNHAISGVQFYLDGNALGGPVSAFPYSIPWNTALVPNGPHVLTAIAADADGNTAIAPAVNVLVSNSFTTISGIAVTAVSSGTATISWSTNVPASSQVVYGTTASYGLFTLQDPVLAITHTMSINGLMPGRTYHFQVLSVNASGVQGSSGDQVFTTNALPATIGTLNGHSVHADNTGRIIPWNANPAKGYDTVMYLAWNWLMNSAPIDNATGKPAYYSRSFFNPANLDLANWPHNPACLYAGLVESGLKYYHYSGNAAVMKLAEEVALWQLDFGMTLPTDLWASVPYASADPGVLTYKGCGFGAGVGDGIGVIEPDKVGEMGIAFLQLYKFNGNIRFRDAAIQAANALSQHIRTGSFDKSPWPFRVDARTGVSVDDYCTNTIAPIALFDELIADGLGNVATYQTARNNAWNWLMTYPMQNNQWAQYFEDVFIQPSYNTNINQYNPMMTARYLLEHPEFDPNWESHVRGLITWVENIFGVPSFGALSINEQTPAFPSNLGSHTARYGSVNALLYERTGDLAARDKAFYALNWATYMSNRFGVVIDGPGDNMVWFSDGYGDYIKHFMTGIGAVPAWAPYDQSSMVRAGSIVQDIVYSTNSMSYKTFDGKGIDVIRINFTPTSVTADGLALAQRTELNQPGWTLDVANKILRVNHAGARQIVINGNIPPPVVQTSRAPEHAAEETGKDPQTGTQTPALTSDAERHSVLIIYPNPGHGEVTVKFNASGSKEAVIRVLDLQGRQVFMTAKAKVSNRFGQVEARIPKLKPGIYVVSVQQGSSLQYGKLVVQ